MAMTAPASAATASRRLARLMNALFFFRLSPFSLNRMLGTDGQCSPSHIMSFNQVTRDGRDRWIVFAKSYDFILSRNEG